MNNPENDPADEKHNLEQIEEIAHPEIHFCILSLGGRRLSLQIENIKEITDPQNIIPLPGTPDYIVGLFQIRGTVLPVVDIARIYDTHYSDDKEKKLIIIENMNEHIALLSDGMPDLSEEQDGELIDINIFFEKYRVT